MTTSRSEAPASSQLTPTHQSPFTISATDGRVAHIAIEGELVVGNRQQLKQHVIDLLEQHPGLRELVIDVKRCPYIDSSGLGVLVSIRRTAERTGCQVTIEGPNDDLATLFELTGIASLFTLRDVEVPRARDR